MILTLTHLLENMMYPQLQLPMLPWNPEEQNDSQLIPLFGKREAVVSWKYKTITMNMLHALNKICQY